MPGIRSGAYQAMSQEDQRDLAALGREVRSSPALFAPVLGQHRPELVDADGEPYYGSHRHLVGVAVRLLKEEVAKCRSRKP